MQGGSQGVVPVKPSPVGPKPRNAPSVGLDRPLWVALSGAPHRAQPASTVGVACALRAVNKTRAG